MPVSTDKFKSPEALPTPFEAELLTVLVEEFLEAGIRDTKTQRFGISEKQPGQGFTNGQRLGHELGDVLCVVGLLLDYGIVDRESIEYGMANKAEQLERFLQQVPPGGDLFGMREQRRRKMLMVTV